MSERLTDEKIARDIRAALKQDPRIRSRGISVQVEAGVATLSGTAGSYAERMAAAEDAWRVRGASEVRNRLQVQPGTLRPDEEIASEITEALAEDERVNDRGIVVQVAEAIVRLSGAVSTELERAAAEEDACKVEGVVDVSNELTVSPDRRRSDQDIEADVRAALNQDNRITDPTSIKVRSVAGTVRLEGTVASAEERQAAEKDAWYTGGVVYVENLLRLMRDRDQPAAA